jgi:hypothetical protein
VIFLLILKILFFINPCACGCCGVARISSLKAGYGFNTNLGVLITVSEQKNSICEKINFDTFVSQNMLSFVKLNTVKILKKTKNSSFCCFGVIYVGHFFFKGVQFGVENRQTAHQSHEKKLFVFTHFVSFFLPFVRANKPKIILVTC